MDQIGPFDAFKYLMLGDKEGILFLNARLKENRAIYSTPDRPDYSERELTDVLYIALEDVIIGGMNLAKIRERVTFQEIDLDHIKVVLSSNEDMFFFKTMTEREGDLEDCIGLAQTGIEWEIIFSELKSQMKESKQNIWITWLGERLDLLEERGLTIPIMAEINKLRDNFSGEWEKTQLQQK